MLVRSLQNLTTELHCPQQRGPRILNWGCHWCKNSWGSPTWQMHNYVNMCLDHSVRLYFRIFHNQMSCSALGFSGENLTRLLVFLGGLANSAVLHSFSLMTVLWISCSHPRRSGVGCAVSWTWCCKWETSIPALAKGDQHQFNLFSCSRNLKKLLQLRLTQRCPAQERSLILYCWTLSVLTFLYLLEFDFESISLNN